MKIEVGMYVRTKDGFIEKIENGEEFYEPSVDVGIGTIPDIEGIRLNDDGFSYVDRREIIKASFNIIDLIEVGDIISFKEDIDNYKKTYVIGIVDTIFLDEIKDKILNDNIRLIGILTHEQFESMSYKIGE